MFKNGEMQASLVVQAATALVACVVAASLWCLVLAAAAALTNPGGIGSGSWSMAIPGSPAK